MRPLINYEGLYSISEDGKVWSWRKSGWLSPTSHPDGYSQVTLCKDGDRWQTTIHRLVALMFVSKPEGMDVVNHLDEDPSNDHYTNLEWTDIAGNTRHSMAKTYKITSPKGRVIEFTGLQKFCNENGLTMQNLSKVILGRANHHKGWTICDL